ncbi:HAD-IA family hydrolase [Moheibacter stercoris]|uniref:phosphoglycolate phosphatase n=1 Tax=Moheibacter stercoris TaxID=1628251 RepID=A0ABV2LRG4_9FLAO
MQKLLYWAKVWFVTIFLSCLINVLILTFKDFGLDNFLTSYFLFVIISVIYSTPTFIILGLILFLYKSKNTQILRYILSALSLIGISLTFYFLGFDVIKDGFISDAYIMYIYMVVMVASIFYFRIHSTPKIKLIIFDLDGTLLNTYEDLGNSVNYVLAKYGFPTHELELYRTFIGNGIDNLLKTCLPENFHDEVKFQQIRKEFVTHYEAHKYDLTRPYDGIQELLQELQAREFKLAIASNKYHEATVNLVKRYFPSISFDVVLGHRIGEAKKPNPSILMQIMNETQINQEKTLFVGDSGVDMMTASNADVKSIGVTWGFRTEEELRNHAASKIIHQPLNLLKLIN